MGQDRMSCFSTSDEASAWAGHEHRSGTTLGRHYVGGGGRLSNTIHEVVSATEVPMGHVTACHSVAHLFSCHHLPVTQNTWTQLFQVTTNAMDDSSELRQRMVLDVLCHHDI